MPARLARGSVSAEARPQWAMTGKGHRHASANAVSARAVAAATDRSSRTPARVRSWTVNAGDPVPAAADRDRQGISLHDRPGGGVLESNSIKEKATMHHNEPRRFGLRRLDNFSAGFPTVKSPTNPLSQWFVEPFGSSQRIRNAGGDQNHCLKAGIAAGVVATVRPCDGKDSAPAVAAERRRAARPQRAARRAPHGRERAGRAHGVQPRVPAQVDPELAPPQLALVDAAATACASPRRGWSVLVEANRAGTQIAHAHSCTTAGGGGCVR